MAKYLNLKVFHQYLGLSQVQLSGEIGLTQGYISELKKGKKQITKDVLSKLYDRYGIDVVDEWMQESPVVQQPIDGEANNDSGIDDVTVCSEGSIPMEAFNRMLAEIAEQRKIVAKSQEQLTGLQSLAD